MMNDEWRIFKLSTPGATPYGGMLQLFFDGALAGQVLRLVFDTAALRGRHRSRVQGLVTRRGAAARADGVAAQLCPPERGSVAHRGGQFAGRLDFFNGALAGQVAAARRAALRQQNYSYAYGVAMRSGACCAGRQSRSATLSTINAVSGKFALYRHHQNL